MNALEAKETIQCMYKGDPTITQMDALEIAYKALDKQFPIEVKERKVLKDMHGHPYTIREIVLPVDLWGYWHQIQIIVMLVARN